MPSADRLDHTVLNVKFNLDTAATLFGKLGFTLTPRGYHSHGSMNQLMMFEPEEVVLGCEKVNLYIGRGTTGPFTEQTDFTWVMNNFELGLDGYAQRVVPA